MFIRVSHSARVWHYVETKNGKTNKQTNKKTRYYSAGVGGKAELSKLGELTIPG